MRLSTLGKKSVIEVIVNAVVSFPCSSALPEIAFRKRQMAFVLSDTA